MQSSAAPQPAPPARRRRRYVQAQARLEELARQAKGLPGGGEEAHGDVPLPSLDPVTGEGGPPPSGAPAAGSGAAFARSRRGNNGRISFMLDSMAGRHAGPAPKHLRLQSHHSRINEGFTSLWARAHVRRRAAGQVPGAQPLGMKDVHMALSGSRRSHVLPASLAAWTRSKEEVTLGFHATLGSELQTSWAGVENAPDPFQQFRSSVYVGGEEVEVEGAAPTRAGIVMRKSQVARKSSIARRVHAVSGTFRRGWLPEDLGPLGDPLRKRKRVLPPVWDRLTAGVVPSSTALIASLKDEEGDEAGSNRGTPSPALPPLAHKQGAKGQQKQASRRRKSGAAAAGGAARSTGAASPTGGKGQPSKGAAGQGGYARRRSVSTKWLAEQMVKHTTLFAWPGGGPEEEEEEEQDQGDQGEAQEQGSSGNDSGRLSPSMVTAGGARSPAAAAPCPIQDTGLTRPPSAQPPASTSAAEDNHQAASPGPKRAGGRVSFARVSAGAPSLVVGRVRFASSSSVAMYRASMRRASAMMMSHISQACDTGSGHTADAVQAAHNTADPEDSAVSGTLAQAVAMDQRAGRLGGQGSSDGRHDNGSDSDWEEMEDSEAALADGADTTHPADEDLQHASSDPVPVNGLDREASVLGFLASILVPCSAEDSSPANTNRGSAGGAPAPGFYSPANPAAGATTDGGSSRLHGIRMHESHDMMVIGVPALEASPQPQLPMSSSGRLVAGLAPSAPPVPRTASGRSPRAQAATRALPTGLGPTPLQTSSLSRPGTSHKTAAATLDGPGQARADGQTVQLHTLVLQLDEGAAFGGSNSKGAGGATTTPQQGMTNNSTAGMSGYPGSPMDFIVRGIGTPPSAPSPRGRSNNGRLCYGPVKGLTPAARTYYGPLGNTGTGGSGRAGHGGGGDGGGTRDVDGGSMYSLGINLQVAAKWEATGGWELEGEEEQSQYAGMQDEARTSPEDTANHPANGGAGIGGVHNEHEAQAPLLPQQGRELSTGCMDAAHHQAGQEGADRSGTEQAPVGTFATLDGVAHVQMPGPHEQHTASYALRVSKATGAGDTMQTPSPHSSIVTLTSGWHDSTLAVYRPTPLSTGTAGSSAALSYEGAYSAVCAGAPLQAPTAHTVVSTALVAARSADATQLAAWSAGAGHTDGHTDLQHPPHRQSITHLDDWELLEVLRRKQKGHTLGLNGWGSTGVLSDGGTSIGREKDSGWAQVQQQQQLHYTKGYYGNGHMGMMQSRTKGYGHPLHSGSAVRCSDPGGRRGTALRTAAAVQQAATYLDPANVLEPEASQPRSVISSGRGAGVSAVPSPRYPQGSISSNASTAMASRCRDASVPGGSGAAPYRGLTPVINSAMDPVRRAHEMSFRTG